MINFKKIFLTSFLLICGCHPLALAATIYVRCDGGTGSQCDGTHDAPLTGAVDGADPGTLPDCAYNSPNYANGGNQFTGGSAGTAVASDTIMIDGELRSGCAPTASGRAEYEVGSMAPNMTPGNQCSAPGGGFPYGCAPNYWPAGTSSASRTKIYGYGYNTGCKRPPQLWGSNAIGLSGSNYAGVMSINGNTSLSCIEITDHSGCIVRHHGAGTIDNSITEDPITCSETFSGSGPGRWAGTGLKIADGAGNIDISNVWVHSMGMHGVHANSLSGGITLNNFYNYKNGYDNWTGLDNAHYSNTNGSNSWIGGTNSYGGCGQKYPPTYAIPRSRAQWRDSSDVHDCWTQGQGAGYGDCYGISARSGTWTIKRVDAFGCASDAWDFLYDPTATMTFAQNTCEGNNGACFKTGSGNSYVENNTMLGNCPNFKDNAIAYTSINSTGRSGATCNNNGICNSNENSTNCADCPAFAFCRANTPLSLNMSTGSHAYVWNNTIESNFDVALYAQGITAGGIVDMQNNVFIGGRNYLNGTDMGDQSAGYYSDGASVTLTADYNFICNTKNIGTDCSGQANSHCYTSCSSLDLAGPLLNDNPFYQGINYLGAYFLNVTSPAHGLSSATESLSFQLGAYDSTGFNRRSTWDAGGIEYRPPLNFSTDEFRVTQE